MNNYQNIATIFIRVSALCIFMYAVMEWGIIAAGILLSTFQIIKPTSMAFDTRFITSIFYLLVALILFVRSKSLAGYIVEGLVDAESPKQE